MEQCGAAALRQRGNVVPRVPAINSAIARRQPERIAMDLHGSAPWRLAPPGRFTVALTARPSETEEITNHIWSRFKAALPLGL